MKYDLTCIEYITDFKDIHIRDKQMLVNDVATWIVRWLEDGPRQSGEIVRDAVRLGYNEKTVRRAISQLIGTEVIVSESISEKDKPNARQYRLTGK